MSKLCFAPLRRREILKCNQITQNILRDMISANAVIPYERFRGIHLNLLYAI